MEPKLDEKASSKFLLLKQAMLAGNYILLIFSFRKNLKISDILVKRWISLESRRPIFIFEFCQKLWNRFWKMMIFFH